MFIVVKVFPKSQLSKVSTADLLPNPEVGKENIRVARFDPAITTPTDLKFGPTMRTEEEAVPPVLLVMLDLVRLLVCDTLKHREQ